MEEETNLIYTNVEETNAITETIEEISVEPTNTDFYNTCKNIYTILSVLVFVIVVIFIYRYLKAIIKRKR